MGKSEFEQPVGGLSDQRGRPLRDLRISVTNRCNFRCPYCMPAEIFGEKCVFLPRNEILTFEEIERLVRLFVGLGVERIRITGGEPLLRHGLEDLVAKLAVLGPDLDLALTTDGSLLLSHAEALARAGLRRIAVSLESLAPAIFHRMGGERFCVERVLEGIRAAEAAGFEQIESTWRARSDHYREERPQILQIEGAADRRRARVEMDQVGG